MFADSSSTAATSSSSSVKDSGTKLGEGSLSGMTRELPFSSGNPTIEETRGVMHLFRDDVASSVSKLPVETCHVSFLIDVLYTGSIEHAHGSVLNSSEQPNCPVCLACELAYVIGIRRGS